MLATLKLLSCSTYLSAKLGSCIWPPMLISASSKGIGGFRPGKNQADLSYYLQACELLTASAVSTTRPYLMHTTNLGGRPALGAGGK